MAAPSYQSNTEGRHAHTGNTRGHRALWWTLGILAALILIVVFFPWDVLRGPVERKISESTGRHFEMAHLDVKYSWPPRIVATGVRFDNPNWARERQMLTADEISFTISLPPLFHKDVVMPDVWLVAPVIALQVSDKGTPNWMLHPDDPPQAEGQASLAPTVQHLSVDRGKLSYFDPGQKTDLAVDLSSQGSQAKDVLTAVARGKYHGFNSGADAGGGGVLTLMRTDEAYPFKAEFHAGATAGKVEGSITGLTELKAADLQLDVHGDSMEELYPLIGLSLPATPPYQLKGRLQLKDGVWMLHGFDGRVGDSDLGGDADVAYVNKRPSITADLRSHVVDMNDLAGFIGGTPSAGPGQTASPQQKKKAAEEAASPRMLPSDPIHLDKLRSMDADVKYTGESIRNLKSPIDGLRAHLILKDGDLQMEPLNFGVAGGQILTNIGIDARADKLKVAAKAEVRHLELSKLFPKSSKIATTVGVLGGRMEFKGNGNSVAELASHADGKLGLATRGGQISNLILEAVGLDAFEIVKFLFKGDRNVQLRCAVADFDIRDGLATSRAFVVDTSDTNVHVGGDMNLRDESLDLRVHALPKDYSPLSLRSPLHVKGTFKNPKVRPDEQLVVKATVATVLGALINPLLALLPLIEPAPGKDEDCARLIAAVQQRTGHETSSFEAAPEQPSKPQSAPKKGLLPHKKGQ
jgi:uncharacterized protein involved in outer membrane biogenesis